MVATASSHDPPEWMMMENGYVLGPNQYTPPRKGDTSKCTVYWHDMACQSGTQTILLHSMTVGWLVGWLAGRRAGGCMRVLFTTRVIQLLAVLLSSNNTYSTTCIDDALKVMISMMVMLLLYWWRKIQKYFAAIRNATFAYKWRRGYPPSDKNQLKFVIHWLLSGSLFIAIEKRVGFSILIIIWLGTLEPTKRDSGRMYCSLIHEKHW